MNKDKDIIRPGVVQQPERIATCNECGCIFRYYANEVYSVDNTAFGDLNASTISAVKCKQEGCGNGIRI